MKIKDSGNRRVFGTGAVRDMAEGKGRCDLLPLDVVAHILDRNGINSSVMFYINDYVRSGVTDFLYLAIEEFVRKDQASMCTAILEVAKHYEEGAKKYDERNWEIGIPLHCYIDSGVRHYIKLLRGDTDEPHDRAFLFNILGAIWTHENKPELIDLPFVNNEKERNG